jgi:anthranilate phosphoribosyltransferase
VVCGADGMDEITTTDATYVAALEKGEIREFTLTPEEFGLERVEAEALIGQDAEYNARALQALLAGRHSAYRDIVLLNSAAALVVAGRVETIAQGLELARESIDAGAAGRVLAALVSEGGHEHA